MKSEQELREFYRTDYAELFERSQSRRRVERLFRLMELSPNDSVADLGCGSGLLVPFVAPRVRQYLGVDFSEEFIRIANRKQAANPFANVRFVCATVEGVANAHPAEFDVVFALDFAEHVYDDGWLDILCGARRLLRAGGRLYLHTPNAEFFLERMKAADFLVRQFPEHVAVRSRAAHILLLEKAGFRVTRALYLPHYNILRIVHVLSLVPCCRSIMSARIFIEARS